MMGFGSLRDFTLGGASISDVEARNAEAQQQLLDDAKQAARADRFFRINERILPYIREMEALGAIPAFQSAGATQVARRGLTGTGLGTAIQSAAGGAGELFALKEALGLSNDIQARQVAAILGFAGVPLGGPSYANLAGQAGENIAARVVTGIFTMGQGLGQVGAGQNTGLSGAGGSTGGGRAAGQLGPNTGSGNFYGGGFDFSGFAPGGATGGGRLMGQQGPNTASGSYLGSIPAGAM